jgi:hypothetical protein
MEIYYYYYLYCSFLYRYVKEYDYYQKCVNEQSKEQKELRPTASHAAQQTGCLCFTSKLHVIIRGWNWLELCTYLHWFYKTKEVDMPQIPRAETVLFTNHLTL